MLKSKQEKGELRPERQTIVFDRRADDEHFVFPFPQAGSDVCLRRFHPAADVGKWENNRYASIPVLNRKGEYVGTLTEGDILWGLKKTHGLDLEAAEDVPISSFAHKRDYKAVTVSTSMDQLIEAAMNQNFVPVVDDRGMFIGIVRRQAIIRYCYDKARSEQAGAKTARRRETVSAVAN